MHDMWLFIKASHEIDGPPFLKWEEDLFERYANAEISYEDLLSQIKEFLAGQ